MSFMDKAKAQKNSRIAITNKLTKQKIKLTNTLVAETTTKRQRRQISLNHSYKGRADALPLFYIMTELLFVIFDKIQVVYLGHKCNLLPLAHQFLHIPIKPSS